MINKENHWEPPITQEIHWESVRTTAWKPLRAYENYQELTINNENLQYNQGEPTENYLELMRNNDNQGEPMGTIGTVNH